MKTIRTLLSLVLILLLSRAATAAPVYVAMIHNGTTFKYALSTTRGTTWTEYDRPGSSDRIIGVANNILFMAYSGNNTIYFSSNGLNWESRTLSISPLNVVYGDGMYVFSPRNGQVFVTSTDLETFTNVTVTANPSATWQVLIKGDRWIIGGVQATKRVFYNSTFSASGWTEGYTNGTAGVNMGPGNYIDGKYYIPTGLNTNNQQFYYSDNGFTNGSLRGGPTNSIAYRASNQAQVAKVGSTFYAPGFSGAAAYATSTNGTEFTAANIPAMSGVTGIYLTSDNSTEAIACGVVSTQMRCYNTRLTSVFNTTVTSTTSVQSMWHMDLEVASSGGTRVIIVND